MMHGKRYRAAVAARPSAALPLREAVTFVKEHARAKFDETVELHVHLGVNPKQSDQMVRGTVALPHGSPSVVRVAVMTDDAALQEASRAAGADVVGGRDLIDRITAEGGLPVDAVVTTPDMMKDLAKVAKILGPRGLMPNPKSGTIGPDPAHLVRALKGGKVTFKMDDSANIHVPVARASWDAEKVEENTRAIVDAIRHAKPSAAKGEYIRSVTLTSTMGPGVVVRI